ncbi:MAG: TrkA C-terminal domain-containing protein [Acidimicrobiia bacterium]|nr:TrkA C-terminal domain-containing protein [Acidimicrobiia bacterium]
MTGVIGVIVVVFVWRFCVLFGAAVFEAAGLPGPAAGFEARSALVGAGYTTSQSELVVRYPPARRVAATLVVFGYFGPALILALLGVSFVVPADEDLTVRVVTLAALLAGLVVVDRIGILHSLARWSATALTQRMTGNLALERWIVVGDHAIAAATIPCDADQAKEVIEALTGADVRVVAIERAGARDLVIPTNSPPTRPTPGDRVVVFGPRSSLDAIRGA